MCQRFLLLAFCILSFAQQAKAQFDLNGSNAKQTIQGQVGNLVDPIDHDIDVVIPTTFQLAIESGMNPFSPVTTLMSRLQPTPGVIPTPWGGSLDLGTFDPVTTLGNVEILADGITFQGGNPFLDQFWLTDGGNASQGIAPRLELNIALSPSVFQPGEILITRAFQSIVSDPTNAPFNLDNTEVTDANFRFGQESILQTGEDGFVTVDFLPGSTFNFHGQTYTQVHVHANGFVTFGGPTNLSNGGADNDHAGWMNDQPSIAGLISDWSPTANSPTDGILYEERSSLVRIAWGDPRAQTSGSISHFMDSDANRFEIILSLDDGQNPLEGTFALSLASLDPGAQVGLGRGLLGHTPGGANLLGGAFDVNLRVTAQSGGPGIAQIEEHDLGGNNASNLGWDGGGSLRNYNQITQHWDGTVLTFQPKLGAGITGSAGYDSIPPAQLPGDQAQSLSLGTISNEGELLTISGSFLGFDPMATGAGSVVFDPAGTNGGPFMGEILVILDDTGASGPLSFNNPQPAESRDGQTLALNTPDFLGAPAGLYDVEVRFASGKIVPFSVNVAPQVIFNAVFVQNDDDFVAHNLSVPVTLYGQTFNQMFVGSNGYVTFGAGANINSGGQFSMNTGYGTPNNVGVAVLFTDLNPIGFLSGSIYEVHEDATLGQVTVTFRNQSYWTTNEPAGTASVTFGDNGPNSFSLDLQGVFPTVSGMAPVSFGVSNGDFLTPITDLSNGSGSGLFNFLPQGGGTGYTSASPGDSIAEDFPRNVSLPFSQPIQFIDMAMGAPFGLWFVQ